MLNPGHYNAVAVDGVLTSTSTGKPQVAVTFEIADGEAAGQKITWFGFFTEKTEERTIESLRIAGWTGSDLSDLSELRDARMPMVDLDVEHDTYEGKTSAKVRWVNRLGGQAFAALEDAAGFAARMRATIAKVDASLRSGGAKPAAKPQPAARPTPQRQSSPSQRRPEPPPSGPPGDEDMPF